MKHTEQLKILYEGLIELAKKAEMDMAEVPPMLCGIAGYEIGLMGHKTGVDTTHSLGVMACIALIEVSARMGQRGLPPEEWIERLAEREPRAETRQ